ncbi:uncharacterized protein B0I36DRAFT_367902 [Microdochium trichocladiopsis]|uniref:Uncharacterized protein n=1 Tax=Microdochium trichocladiopsis TaxID=1682393 RepID=A0A9P8XWJ7_9PEZI|nr:uncharacterized protein B0I36DRAFT_367902 [Microdochium trichocladiopsis]KAH7021500.1 hypothetical protein B0I36DRAFT_367902 [Microdochium trichocladiopsis]
MEESSFFPYAAIDKSSSAKQAILICGGSCEYQLRSLENKAEKCVNPAINIASVGQYALQVANLYGLEALVSCSPKHFGQTASLEKHHYGEFYWPPNKADHELGAEFCPKIGDWLSSGKNKPNKTRIIDGGLDAVTRGFQECRDGKIPGYKLVYAIK